MTPMFPERENKRLCVHAAHTEPVPESCSDQPVLGPAPEGFALHREPSSKAVPVPADARRGPGVQRQVAETEAVAFRALTGSPWRGTIAP